MNSPRALFLSWQDSESRQWYPIGRLDVDADRTRFCFRYTQGAKHAQIATGFPPLYDFPNFDEKYEASNLFPLFQNRVMNARRKSFTEYLESLELPSHGSDPVEILAVDGDTRVADNFQVFPEITKQPDGVFQCRFFLHGWRHMDESAQRIIAQLQPQQQLLLEVVPSHPTTQQVAVKVLTADAPPCHIGWVPRYFVNDIASALEDGECSGRVVRVNSPSALYSQRVLMEINGKFAPDHQPMSSPEFQLLREK